MYLLKINRPDDNVYCTIIYDRGQKGYQKVQMILIKDFEGELICLLTKLYYECFKQLIPILLSETNDSEKIKEYEKIIDQYCTERNSKS